MSKEQEIDVIKGLKLLRNYVFKSEMSTSIANSEYFQKVLNVAIDNLEGYTRANQTKAVDREQLTKLAYEAFFYDQPAINTWEKAYPDTKDGFYHVVDAILSSLPQALEQNNREIK